MQPNIVLLLTDDQDERSLGLVPGVEEAIGAAGGTGTGGDVRPGLRHDPRVLPFEGLPTYGRLCPQPQRAHELPAHRRRDEVQERGLGGGEHRHQAQGRGLPYDPHRQVHERLRGRVRPRAVGEVLRLHPPLPGQPAAHLLREHGPGLGGPRIHQRSHPLPRHVPAEGRGREGDRPVGRRPPALHGGELPRAALPRLLRSGGRRALRRRHGAPGAVVGRLGRGRPAVRKGPGPPHRPRKPAPRTRSTARRRAPYWPYAGPSWTS